MKITGWMKFLPVEPRGHFLNIAFLKFASRISVILRPIKINLSTKSDPIEESSNAELSVSEIDSFRKLEPENMAACSKFAP